MLKKLEESALARDLRIVYTSSEAYLRALAAHDSADYFAHYIAYVRSVVPRGGSLLEVGCGTGFSSTLLAQARYRVVGMDLSPKFLAHRPEGSEISAAYAAGDVTNLPFQDGVFDAVASYNLVEHLPDVERSVTQMMRVVRPGGFIIILAPNILSPYRPLKYLVRILKGRGGLPTFYETVLACLGYCLWSALSLLWKRFGPKPQFRYRVPSLTTCEETDADCVYYANPVDLQRHFRSHGWEIVRYQGQGQDRLRRFLARVTPDFAGAVALTVRKPKIGGSE